MARLQEWAEIDSGAYITVQITLVDDQGETMTEDRFSVATIDFEQDESERVKILQLDSNRAVAANGVYVFKDM